MKDSLDNFVRDAMQEHDDVAAPEHGRPSAGGGGQGQLPGHAVEGLLGRGGMGVIYRARQQSLEREVAVKVMTALANTPAMAERFRREALVLGRLEHPNIVPIHEFGTDDEGQLFYTMKRVKGRNLQDIINALRAGDAQTLRLHTLVSLLTVFRKVCDALAFAHSQGVLHRDLKPANVMVGEFGEVLVMDWGLAKVLNDEKDSSREAPHSSFDIGHSDFTGTLQGSIMGTPQYMSPEQAQGQIDQLDERSDIFSLGGILYAILTLRPPVEGTTLNEVLEKVRTGNITPPSSLQPGTATAIQGAKKQGVLEAKLLKPLPHAPSGRVPAALSSVVMKALRLDKSQRYQTVAAFSADIEAYLGGFATTAEQAGLVKHLKLLIRRHKGIFTTAAAAWLLLAGSGIWFVSNLRTKEQRARAGEEAAVMEKESTRKALAASQVALGEAAFRSMDLPAMVRALDSVPQDLRDQRWEYLSVKRDSSLGEFHVKGFGPLKVIAAIPGRAAQFAIADESGLVGFVNVRTGEVLQKISTNRRGEPVLALTADGTQLALTAAGASAIDIFNVADGKRVKSVPTSVPAITRLVFSPDRNLLAILEGLKSKRSLSLVDLRDGSMRWRLKGTYLDAIFSPDGARLFAASGLQRRFEVIGVEKGDIIREQEMMFNCMAMSRDGRRLALGLRSGEVILIDVATGMETQRFRLHLGLVIGLTWTAGNQLLSVGSDEAGGQTPGVIQLWETKGFLARGTFFGMEQGGRGHAWDFDPASGYLLMGRKSPRLWHIPAGIEKTRFSGASERGWGTCFISDTVVLARGEFTLVRYDVTNPGAPKALPQPGPRRYVTAAPFWPGGKFALACRMDRPPFSIKIYSTANENLVETRDIPTPERVVQMDWDSTGERLLAVYFDSRGLDCGASIFDAGSGQTRLKLPINIKQAIFAGAKGHVIALISVKNDAADVQDDVIVFDSKTGQKLKSVPYHMRFDQLVVSPDRRLVAIGGADMIVRVLDAETLEERYSFRAHDAEISALAFHPKLPVLATGSADGSVKLWDYGTSRLRKTFLGLTGAPSTLAFSPNGRLLSVESVEPTARLFDLGDSGWAP